MFERLFGRIPESRAIAATVYGAIVAQARQPALYEAFGVADSVDGRFEMVVLHTVLVLDRLQSGSEQERGIGQKIFDLYCLDMDRSLRELGVGDLGVPKRMKVMTQRFYGRAAAYRTALAANDVDKLADVIGRNVYASGRDGRALAEYVLASYRRLAAVTIEDVLAGRPAFADLSAVAPAPSGA